jgi:hypothetical protein
MLAPPRSVLSGALAEAQAKEACMMRMLSLTTVAAVVLVGVGCSAGEDPGKAQSLQSIESASSGWRTAQLTTFTSYPACCPDSPVYDPNAPTDECDDYSGCQYMGDFAAIGHKSFSYVKSHDLVAFYDDRDPDGTNFDKNYGGKTIQLKKGSKTFNALIADTCGNSDCNGCCTQNSKGGFLVDMEYWTTERRIGGPDNADGTIQFKILN